MGWLKERIVSEKEKMASMNKKEKAAYIWDYYKVHILALAALLALFIGVLWQLIFNNQETVYHFAVVNEVMDVEKDEALKASLGSFLGIDSRREEVTVDSNYNIPYIYNDDGQLVYADGSPASDFSTHDKYFLNLSQNIIDAAVMPESFMAHCNSIERSYYDLTELFSEEVLEKYEDCFCYGTDADGNTYLCGLYTDGTIFDAAYFAADAGEDLRKACGRQVLAFPLGGENKENNEKFLEWIFEMKINTAS